MIAIEPQASSSGDPAPIMPKVLVVDDDVAISMLAKKALEPIAEVESATTGEEGLQKLRGGKYDAVLLDIMLPDVDGLAVFCEIRERDRRLPVIFMTIEATSNTAIEAMQRGAFDYLAKPLEIASLRVLVSRAIEQRELSSVPVEIQASDEATQNETELFIGRSKPMLDVFKDVGRVSKQDVPVLVRGESGTGKELVARALYQYSHRTEGPFLAVNCAALPDTLLESELFGHEKGAFTGADSRRVGKFEQCNGGTLFMDEIGDMAPIVQAKVLRVLQDQRFQRIGGNNELKTDVRIVAATNQPLEEMVADGEFREDLLYRLNAVTIHLPPLRDRPEDIPLLIQHFLNQAKREFRKPDLEGVSPSTVALLKSYRWPGNVRQLRAVVRRCVLDSVLPVLVPDVLPREIRESGGKASADSGSSVSNAETTLSSNSASAGDGLSVGGEAAAAQLNSEDGGGPEGAGYASSDESLQHPPAFGSDPGIHLGGGGGSSVGDHPGRGLPELVDRLLEDPAGSVYSETIAYVERYVLGRVLELTEGNQSRAAEILGITRGKLRDRIATYDIQLDSGVKIGQ